MSFPFRNHTKKKSKFSFIVKCAPILYRCSMFITSFLRWIPFSSISLCKSCRPQHIPAPVHQQDHPSQSAASSSTGVNAKTRSGRLWPLSRNQCSIRVQRPRISRRRKWECLHEVVLLLRSARAMRLGLRGCSKEGEHPRLPAWRLSDVRMDSYAD